MSRNGHPSGRELKAVGGRLAAVETIRRVMVHLDTGCERCRWLFSELVEEEIRHAEKPAYAELKWATVWEELAAEEMAEAGGLLEELEELPRGRQIMLIRSGERFQTLTLVRYLCAQSRGLLGNEPQRAVQLGHLAAVVAGELDRERYPPGLVEDFYGRAWMRVAGAQQRASDFAAAKLSLDRAERMLDQGTGDPLEQADLCLTRGNLHMELGEAEQALEWLERAAELFDELGDWTEVGKAVAHQGVVLAEAGRLDEALHKIVEASLIIDGKTALHSLMVLHNIALYLTEQGDLRTALAVVAVARPLYRTAGKESGVIKRLWLEGMILVRLGWTEEALERFAQARKRFVEKGWLQEAARVTLEEALYSPPERRAKLIHLLIEEMLPVLRSRGIHAEAQAAILLLAETVKETALTLAIEAAIKVLEPARQKGRASDSGEAGNAGPAGRGRPTPEGDA